MPPILILHLNQFEYATSARKKRNFVDFPVEGLSGRAHIVTPKRRRLISHTYLWGGGFQQYRKSFKIGHKPFYSQVNDKEW